MTILYKYVHIHMSSTYSASTMHMYQYDECNWVDMHAYRGSEAVG